MDFPSAEESQRRDQGGDQGSDPPTRTRWTERESEACGEQHQPQADAGKEEPDERQRYRARDLRRRRARRL